MRRASIFRAFFVGCLILLPLLLLLRNTINNSKAELANKNDLMVEKELQRIFTECLGYTLIGAKPVSVEYCCRLEFSSNLEQKKRFFVALESIFHDSERFLLKVFHYADFYSEVILIDVPALLKLVKKSSYLSRFVKKKYGSIECFYRSLIDARLHIFDCFHRDSIAIGIALGYGEKNSIFHQRYTDLGFYLKKYPFVCTLPFEPTPMPDAITPEPMRWSAEESLYKPFVPEIHSNEFLSLEEEWQWIEKMRNETHYEPELPYLFQLPFFISKKCAETDKICERYSKARDRLAKKFYGRKFSEVIAEEVARK